MTPPTLHTLRRSLGLTQSELGLAVGLTGTARNMARTVRRWEAGAVPVPAWAELVLGTMTNPPTVTIGNLTALATRSAPKLP